MTPTHASTPWEVEYTDEFEAVWKKLSEGEHWYDRMVPVADRLYDEHVEALKKQGLLDGYD